jgi:hypothetical protein
MDSLGLLDAAVAVAVFPGGAFTALVAWTAAGSGRLPMAHARWPAPAVGGLVMLVVACSQVPLPGTPAATLPDRGGAPANLLGVLVLLGAGVGLVAAATWRPSQVVAAIAAGLPPLIIGAASATFAFPVLAGLPGRDLEAARVAAAAALLLAAPHLALPGDIALPRVARATVLAGALLVAAGLTVPATLGSLPGIAVAGIVVAAAAVYGAILALAGRRLSSPVLPCLATIAAATSITIAILATRT